MFYNSSYRKFKNKFALNKWPTILTNTAYKEDSMLIDGQLDML